MKTSVIISSLNRKETVLRLLGSLAAQVQLPDEIVLVESGSVGWALNELPLVFRPIFRVIMAPNESLAAARDLGRIAANGEILFFFDDDILLPQTYISDAINHFSQNHDVMAVGGIYVDPILTARSKSSIAIGRLFGIYSNGSKNRLLSSGWADYVRGCCTQQVTEADWLFGCNFVVRANVFAKAKFETQMKTWSFLEDVFFGTHLKKHYGNCLRVIPSLAVQHAPPDSAGRISEATIRMRILYRYLLWRDHIYPERKLSLAPFSLGMVANLLLLIKQKRELWVVFENFKSINFIIKNRSLDWSRANEFIFSKD